MEDFLTQGFKAVDQELLDYCAANTVLQPRLVRVQELGYYQVLAQVKQTDRYCCVLMGGPNAQEAEANLHDYNQLTASHGQTLTTILEQI